MANKLAPIRSVNGGVKAWFWGHDTALCSLTHSIKLILEIDRSRGSASLHDPQFDEAYPDLESSRIAVS